MIRVALIDYGIDAANVMAIANRLRHASITAIAGNAPPDTADMFKEIIRADSIESLCSQHAAAFDAVAIRSPTGRRADVALSAASSGKHVLLAAPVAESAAATDTLVAACREHDVCLFADLSQRWHPYQQTIKSSLESGQLGQPGLLRIHDWLGTTDESPESLAERITDDLDIVNWCFGLPNHVYAAQLKSNEYAQVHLGFERGGSALLDFANVAAPRGYRSVSMIGADGAAYADDHHNSHIIYRAGAAVADSSLFGMQHWARQLDRFAELMESGTPADGIDAGTESIAAARDAQCVVDAVIASIESGQAMTLKGDHYESV